MASTATILARVRTAIDDLAGDKSVFKENITRSMLGNQVGSGNTSFQLNNRRTSGLQVSVDGAAFVAVSQTADESQRGRFVKSPAPATALLATYDFQFFTDAELTTIIEGSGLSFVGHATVVAVPDGLLDALTLKSSSDACAALASRTMPYYDAAAGGKSFNKNDIAKKYSALAKQHLDAAVSERDKFYSDKKGSTKAPAYGKFSTTQTPYTPKR